MSRHPYLMLFAAIVGASVAVFAATVAILADRWRDGREHPRPYDWGKD